MTHSPQRIAQGIAEECFGTTYTREKMVAKEVEARSAGTSGRIDHYWCEEG